MLIASHRTCASSAHTGRRAPRRGVALVFVLVFVMAMAALAMGSIFMASNSTLLAKSYDRERDLKFAAEAGLAIGKSRVNADPSILIMGPNQLDTAILKSALVRGADSSRLNGVTVSVYVGPSGSTSGQFGRFSSIIAEARDQRGNGFIRRLELTQESFAKFAYWSNSESNSGSTIFFNNGDELWGPVWSNDNINIGTGGATFHDEVATSKSIYGAQYGTFTKGKLEKQAPIALPSTKALANLQAIAKSSGWELTSQTTANNDETNVRDRIEFLAINLDNPAINTDSTGDGEGFFRYYSATSATSLRGDWPGTSSTAPAVSAVNLCGDWHVAPQSMGGGMQFYPASVHVKNGWFQTQMAQALTENGYSSTAANSLASSHNNNPMLDQILSVAGARCYLAGDPHLVAIDRTTSITDPRIGAKYTTAKINRGGTDTTFTPIGVFGSWKVDTSSNKSAVIKTARPNDWQYLYPIDRSYNSNARGVIYVSGANNNKSKGNVGLSGVVNGMITVYAAGTIVLLDDIRYANDPVTGLCHDILGLVTDKDVVIADNAINDPPLVVSGKKNSKYYSLDDTKDMYIHAVMMALGSAFRVENYDQGPTDQNDCNGVNNGRGCIYLSGGIIQQSRGAVGTSNGTGYTKRYSYDRCAVIKPPPYFPTTGRFQENRYLELDPARFDDKAYFQSITPNK